MATLQIVLTDSVPPPVAVLLESPTEALSVNEPDETSEADTPLADPVFVSKGREPSAVGDLEAGTASVEGSEKGGNVSGMSDEGLVPPEELFPSVTVVTVVGEVASEGVVLGGTVPVSLATVGETNGTVPESIDELVPVGEVTALVPLVSVDAADGASPNGPGVKVKPVPSEVWLETVVPSEMVVPVVPDVEVAESVVGIPEDGDGMKPLSMLGFVSVGGGTYPESATRTRVFTSEPVWVWTPCLFEQATVRNRALKTRIQNILLVFMASSFRGLQGGYREVVP